MPKSRALRPFAIATTTATMTNPQGGNKRTASPPRPPSPTFSETTNASAVNLGEHGPAKIVTRSDLKASMQSYENVSKHSHTSIHPSIYLPESLSISPFPSLTLPLFPSRLVCGAVRNEKKKRKKGGWEEKKDTESLLHFIKHEHSSHMTAASSS
jgi:hypothetical protein